MAGVVVGVDGSEPSLRALREAARAARCRDAGLRVVHVYQPVHTSDVAVTAAVVGSGMWTLPAATGSTLLRTARRRSDEEQAQAQHHAGQRLRCWVDAVAPDLAGLTVDRTVIGHEHPSAALLRLAQSADLLVVGSRGHGGFAGVLMGSVSLQCVHHSSCPVLVVRPSDPDAEVGR